MSPRSLSSHSDFSHRSGYSSMAELKWPFKTEKYKNRITSRKSRIVLSTPRDKENIEKESLE